jgi:1-deoxy-D-xylulose-5-phosphate synthase
MNTPAAVRYPRGAGPGVAYERTDFSTLPVGKGELRRRGGKVAILAFGSMLAPALAAAETLGATVANMRFVKPLDEELVLSLADSHELLVTVEENVVMGGSGSAVLECLQARGRAVQVLLLGLPDRFIEQGDPALQLAACGLDKGGIERAVTARMRAAEAQQAAGAVEAKARAK